MTKQEDGINRLALDLAKQLRINADLEQQNAGLRDRNGLYEMEVRQLRRELERIKHFVVTFK